MSNTETIMRLRNAIDRYIANYAETGNQSYMHMAKELLKELKLIKEQSNDNS